MRLSLDLAPAAYRELQEFCIAAAVALERPRIASVESAALAAGQAGTVTMCRRRGGR